MLNLVQNDLFFHSRWSMRMHLCFEKCVATQFEKTNVNSLKNVTAILYIKATELGGWLACPRRPNCLTHSIYGGIYFLPHDPSMILVTPGQSVRSGSRSVTDGSGDGVRGLLESSPITHEEISLTPPC
jgi:hypothetical protein